MISVVLLQIACFIQPPSTPELRDGHYHVYPGQDIQQALELAAEDRKHKAVRVHAGTYRPRKKGQALIWFNAKHEGISLEADGEVNLTAANPAIADRTAASFPAVVNHVVYFGDGITRKTVLRGFKITGGNNFVTDEPHEDPIEPSFDAFRKTEGIYGHVFFYTDGAGVKIFGRSYPTLDRLEVLDNYASPCAGGVSIEHRGFMRNSVLIQNCVFRDNRCLITGSAVDLLPKSSAEIRNCLFVGNISNQGISYTPVKGNIDWPSIPRLMETAVRYQPRHGSGALTVFPGSRVIVDRCTFTENFNGVDDKGTASIFKNSIFWMNNADGGVRQGSRYELDILRANGVQDCFIKGTINDLRKTIDLKHNNLSCEDPDFDERYVPQNRAFSHVGYRP